MRLSKKSEQAKLAEQPPAEVPATEKTRTRTMSPEKVLANKLVKLKSERDALAVLSTKYEKLVEETIAKHRAASAAYEKVKADFLADAD